MRAKNTMQSRRSQSLIITLTICAMLMFLSLFFLNGFVNAGKNQNPPYESLNGFLGSSDLTNANITVETSEEWYANNSNVELTGNLEADESVENLTIIIEIYFESESTPTYTFYNTTDGNGDYEYTFLMSGTGKEGNFSVYVGVVGEPSPINNTYYLYDGTSPTVSSIDDLPPWTDSNPALSWNAASDNNVTSNDLIYSVFRAVKTVGQVPVPSDYVLINNSVSGTTWTQPGALTSNRDYYYIISVRDLAGNSANYSSVNTTYDVSKPIINPIISPIPSGVYANTVNITARITDSINFTAWAHVANGTINSSQISLLASGYNNEYTALWSIPGSYQGTYNVTFYAEDDLNHLRISSNVSFEITTLAPYILDVAHNSPTYYQNGSITVRVHDSTGASDVDTVILTYSTDAGFSSSTNVTMDLLNGTVDDGYYNATLPTYDYYLFGTSGPHTRIYFKIWANDTDFGNTNITTSFYYDIDDDIEPDLVNIIQTPSIVQFFNEISLSINVTEPTDASGVDLSIAYLEYWNGTGGARTNLTLSNRGGDKYNALFQSFFENERIPPFNFNDEIYYRIWAKDQEDNWNHTQTYTYTVEDNVAPQLVDQGLFNAPINYNDTANVWVNFTDVYANASTLSSGINEATIEINYTINGGTSWNVQPMLKFYGNSSQSSWGFNITTLAYGTNVIYNFLLEDNENNALNTGNYSYTVVDQYKPTYSSFQSDPANPTYRNQINISIIPSEPLNASGVNYVNITFVNATGSYGPFTLSAAGSTHYYMISKQDYDQLLNVTLTIYDNVLPTPNTITPSVLSLYIDDNEAPSAGSVLVDAHIQYYEHFNISINATEYTAGDATPSGIKNATLEYNIGAGTIRILMNRTSGDNFNGTWNAFLPYLDEGTQINYQVFVYDNAGNRHDGLGLFNIIEDDRNPTHGSPVVQNAPVEYDEQSNITIRVMEETVPANSSGMNLVRLHYSVTTGVWNVVDCNLYSGTIRDGFWSASVGYLDYDTEVTYYIEMVDDSGNSNQTGNYTYTITDLKAATITNVDDGVNHYYHTSTEVLVDAIEPQSPALASGISTVFLNYSVNNGENIQIEMDQRSGGIFDGTWNASIPAQDYGSVVRYNITIIDNKGNVGYSPQNYTYTVDDNVLPTFDPPIHQDTNNLDGNLEYYENIEILIDIQEVNDPTYSSGVDTVTLNYSTNGVDWNQVFMDKKSAAGGIYEGTWNHTFSAGTFIWNTTTQYNIIIRDIAGNSDTTSTYSFTITDLQKPTTNNLRNLNAPAMYYKQSNITIDINEPSTASGVENATLQYSLTGVIWNNLTASLSNGSIYLGSWSALLPYFDYGVSLQVRYRIFDREGNLRITAPLGVFIDDDVDPSVNSIAYDTDCEYYESNTIILNITEESSPAISSGVNTAHVNYSVNGGAELELSMVRFDGTVQNGLWNCTIPRRNYGDSIRFYYIISDVAGNVVISSNNTYSVRDHVAPTHGIFQIDDDNNHDGMIEYFERATIRLSVSEVASPTSSSGILSVTLRYSFDQQNWVPAAMVLQSGGGIYSGLFNYTFNTLDWNTTVYFNVSILDVETNERITGTSQFTVNDTIKPTAGSIYTENFPVMYYQEGVVVAQFTEPVKASGIDSVTLNYSNNGGINWHQIPMAMKNASGYWNASLPQHAYGTVIQFTAIGIDNQGNSKISSTSSFTVQDDVNPAVISHVTSGILMYYTPVDINITVTEATNASGVSSVILNYAVDGINQAPITMDLISGDEFNGIWNGTIGVQDYGSIVTYNFTVTDLATNELVEADSDQYTVDDDVDPTVDLVYFDDGNDGIIEYDESAEVVIELSEETTPALSSGIDVVVLNFTSNNWLTSSSKIMTQKTGIDKWDGSWNAFLPEFNWSVNLRFKVNVTDVAGNSIETAENSTVIGDLQAPSFGTPAIQGVPVEYHESINISITLQEPTNSSGLDVATLNYSYYGSTWFTTPMSLSSGNIFSGTWIVNLSLYLEYGTLFRYRIIANDTAGNEDRSNLYQFTIEDLTNPVINEITLTDNGDGANPVIYSERGILKINVSEDISPNRSSGLDLVRTYYDINNSGSWSTATTLKESYIIQFYNEMWNATIPRQDYGSVIRYYITVTDKRGNTLSSSISSYTVNDTVIPTFGAITSVNKTYYRNPVISAIVQEPSTPTLSSGVFEVHLNVSFGSSWFQYPMALISGNVYSGTYRVSLPDLNYGTNVSFTVVATDVEGNSAESGLFSFLIGDDKKPVFTMINQSYSNPDYNESQVIDVQITEGVNASGINQSRVILFYENSTGNYNVSMVHYSGPGSPYLNDWWRATIPVESQYNQNISYYFQVYDRAGNFNISSTYWYLINDTHHVDVLDAPILVNDPIEYDEEAEISLNASEPALAAGIDFLRLRWRNDTSGWMNVSMSLETGNQYKGNIPRNEYNTSIEWHVILVDLAGNMLNYSATTNITIIDATAPIFVSYTTDPTPIEALGITTIFATFNEPIDASGLNTTTGSAKIHWNRTGGAPEVFNQVDNMTWNSSAKTFDFDMPAATVSETVTFYFEIYDIAGNNINTTIFSYIPNDTDPPTINDNDFDSTVNYYQQLNVTVNASDEETGVNQVVVYYQINSTSGSWSNLSASLVAGTSISGNWSVLVPRQRYGSSIYMWFKAIDGVGREISDDNSSNYYLATVIDDVAPSIDTIRVNGTIPSSADIEYHENARVTARVYKPTFTTLAAGITNVILNYSISGDWVEIPMSRSSGSDRDGIWAAIIPAGVLFGTEVNFTIYAEDDPGNSTVSSVNHYTVTDHVSPMFSDVAYDGSMYYELLNVSIRIYRDVNASSVSSVTLSYLVDSTPFSTSMSLQSGTNQDGTWEVTIGPFNYDEIISMSINCIDQGGNSFAAPAIIAPITIDDDIDPSIDSISDPGIVRYYNEVNITTIVTEIEVPTESSGIDETSVLLNYTTDGWSSSNTIAMSVSLFDKFNSTFSAVIPEQDWNTTVDFKIQVSDIAGNTAELAGTSYIISDDITSNITPFGKFKDDAFYHEQIQISANITEETSPKLASGVKNATLHFRVDGGIWNTLAMTMVSGDAYLGNWSVSIPEQDYNSFIEYFITCYDFAGNFADSGFNKSYTVDDNRVPTYDITPNILDTNNRDGSIEYNETGLIEMRLFEEQVPALASGVQQASLNYSVNGSAWVMIQKNSPKNGSRFDGWWNWTIPVQPWDTNITFKIIIIDEENNENISQEYSYIIEDNQAPVLAKPTANTPIEYNKNATITVQVSERSNGVVSSYASGVVSVWINYSVDGGISTTLAATRTAGDKFNGFWSVTLPVFNWNETISYNATAIDKENNRANSMNNAFTVNDTNAPQMGTPTVENAPVQYYESATISVQVNESQSIYGTDASGVDSVDFHYSIDGVYQGSLSCSLDTGTIYQGTWNVNLPSLDYGIVVTGFMRAFDRDLAGSPRTSSNFSFSIFDDTVPVVASVGENQTVANYDDYIEIIVAARDGFGEPTLSSGISPTTGVTIYYRFDSNPWQQAQMVFKNGTNHDGNYTHVINPQSYARSVSYYLLVEDMAGNSIYNGNYSYVVNDTVAPVIGIPRSNTPEYNERPEFDIEVSEPLVASGIQEVILHYSVNGGTTEVANAVLIQGDNYHGNWSIDIPMRNYNDVIDYNFSAIDMEGNEAYSSNGSMTIIDTQSPILINPTVTNAPVAYNEYPYFELTVLEDISPETTVGAGIDTVLLNYTATGIPGFTVVEMNGTTNSSNIDDFTATLDNYFNWSAVISYTITANDTAGNFDTYSNSFTIIDPDAPNILQLQYEDELGDGNVEYNETVKISCLIREAPFYNTSSGINLGSVALYYRFGGSGSWNTIAMVRESGDIYESRWNATIIARPYDTLVQYFVSVGDNALNKVNSSTGSYTVVDLHDPRHSNIEINGQQPGAQPVYYSQNVSFSITASEDATASGVDRVRIRYSINSSAYQFGNMVMNAGDSFLGVWQWNRTAMNFGTTFAYSFVIDDVAGNSNQTTENMFTVQDNQKPVNTNLTVHNAPVEYNDNMEIRVTVLEARQPALSSGISTVEINYTYNGVDYYSDFMSGLGSPNNFNRTFRYILPDLLSWGTTVNFTVGSIDAAGNKRTSEGSYTIRDNTPSVINNILLRDNNNEDGFYEYNESLMVEASLQEALNASGISHALLNYSIDGGAKTTVNMSLYSGNATSGIWRYTFGQYPFNTTLRYNISIIDNAGNRKSSTNFTVITDDLGEPALQVPIVNNGTAVTYLDEIYFNINVSKPINSAPIDYVNISYRINTGTLETHTTTMVNAIVPGYNETWQYMLPRLHASDNITFSFTAIDVNGNSETSALYPVQVIDDVPTVLDRITLNGETNSTEWEVSFDETINITIDLLETDGITNGSGIDVVKLFYRSKGSEINNTEVSMSRLSGDEMNGTWYHEVPALEWSGTVYLKIEARDNTGLETNYMVATYQINQTDNYLPSISGVTSLSINDYPGYYDIAADNSTYLAEINATLTVLPNSSGLNLEKTFVQFRPTNETIWRNATLSHTGVGDIFSAHVYGMKWQQDIVYRVYVENNFGISSISSENSYYAVDQEAPDRVSDTIGNVFQDVEVEVSITLHEPVNASGINHSSVMVQFRSEGEGSWNYNVLGFISAGKFDGEIAAYPAGTTVFYKFIYADNVGNNDSFPQTNYTYTIGDQINPYFNNTETAANAPTEVRYQQPVNFSIFCGDADSSISAITISFTVGTQPSVYLTSFTQVAPEEYVITLPSQNWSYGDLGVYVVNITDSSGNTLDVRSSSSRIYIDIIDYDAPVLNNGSIQVVKPYQVAEMNHSVRINFTASEPYGASGLANVSLVYSNSTNDTGIISSINPSGNTFSFPISGQKPFTSISYYFLIEDKAGNLLNTSIANRTFKLDYFETRNVNESYLTELEDPFGEQITDFSFHPSENISVRVSEYDDDPEAVGPKFGGYTVLGKYYKMRLNESGAVLTTGEIIFYYDEIALNASNLDESSLQLARFTPEGYTPLDNYLLDVENNRIIFNNVFELQTQLFTQALGYAEIFAILGQFTVPVPQLESPTIEAGSIIYGTVVFNITTETEAENVSLYYKIGVGGALQLIAHNTTAGKQFTIEWNTTTIPDSNEVSLRMIATNAQGYSDYNETSGFFFTVRNAPDANIIIPPSSIYTGNVSLMATSTIPASRAEFYYFQGGSNYSIGINSTIPAWDGYYPFTGSCEFWLVWNTTLLGDLDNLQVGVNLSGYYDTFLIGNDLSSSFKNVRNVPNSRFLETIAFNEDIYGNRTLFAQTDYLAKNATFYIQLSNGSFMILGTNSSVDGFNFEFRWNTSSIAEESGVRLYVNITNYVGDSGISQYLNNTNLVIFNVLNKPVIVNYMPIPNLQEITGPIILNVTVRKESAPIPTRAIFVMYHASWGNHTVIGIDDSWIETTDGYYLFEILWDTRLLPDNLVLLNVTVENEMGHSVNNSAPRTWQLENIPEPVINTPLSGNVNSTVTIEVSTTYYAAYVDFYLRYLNDSIVNLTGNTYSFDGNYTIYFDWETWRLDDADNVRLGVVMYSLGRYNEPAVESGLFNIRNRPIPTIISPVVSPGDNLFGNITITATTPLNATNATFYYRNGTGTYEVNGPGSGTVISPDNKTFTIIWQSDLLPEMMDVYLSVVMTSTSQGGEGGYPGTSPEIGPFNLQNVPNAQFESISQAAPGVISGTNVQIVVKSDNLAVNATLYCIVPSVGYSEQIGFQVVQNVSGTYYATFTWNSLSFTENLLLAHPGLYDPEIDLRVDMANAIGNNGSTVTVVDLYLYNTPSLNVEIPARISNEALVNVTNDRSYVVVNQAYMWFYNDSTLINRTMSSILPNQFYHYYDFSSFDDNASSTFHFLEITSTGIQRYGNITVEIKNTPEPMLTGNGTLPGENTIISGNTTFVAYSSIRFSLARFSIRYNTIDYQIGSFTSVNRISNHSYDITINFDSLNFTNHYGLDADIGEFEIIVQLQNDRGATGTNITSGYYIYNAPDVNITANATISGLANIQAENIRTYITDTSAYFRFHNGFDWETVAMNATIFDYYEIAWNSTFVGDNDTFQLYVIIESDLGVNGTSVISVNIDNGNDYMIFLPANITVSVNISTKMLDVGTIPIALSIQASVDAYLRINFASFPSSVPNTTGLHFFDQDNVFDIEVFDRNLSTSIDILMNATFYYDLATFLNYQDDEGVTLNKSSIFILKSNETDWIFLDGVYDESTRSFTVSGLSSLSIFMFGVFETGKAPQIDFFTVIILLTLIGVIVGVSMYATRPETIKEQMVPGKKKTCKKCGKYVKPYVTTCPYCGTKLTEEETLADAMNKLRHLFIFHEESGVCLYYHPFTNVKIDPQLISGFLSAITSFGGQFDDATKKRQEKGAKKSSDLKELVYKEYRILMETSGPCKFAVLIQGQTSKILSFKISQFIKHFMRTYQETLKDWKGNVRIFKDVDKMVRLIFGLTRVQDAGKKAGTPAPPAKGTPAPSISPRGPKPSQAKVPAVKPSKPRPPTTPSPGQKPPGKGKGELGKSSATLFKMKDEIGDDGKKALDKEEKQPFSPKTPPELEDKKKKKKKK